MRIVFLGNDRWSVPPLRVLAGAGGIDVSLVVTNPPRPAGRGSALTPTPVATEARAAGLPLLEVEGVRDGEGFDALGRLDPDAIVVVAYGEILSRDVLQVPRLGCVNLHFSLLPRWRGAAPVQRAILAGDDTTGVTVMLMDEGMDTGPIVVTEETAIGADEDAGSLGGRLAEIGGRVLIGALRALEAGSVEPRSQDHAAATQAPKLLPDERTIGWTAPSDAVVRKVRAFAPEPGAVTIFREARLKVFGARDLGLHGRMLADAHRPGPGWIAVDDDGRVIAEAGRSTSVELLDVAPAGRRRMPAAEWARGARIPAGGERIG